MENILNCCVCVKNGITEHEFMNLSILWTKLLIEILRNDKWPM